MAISEMYRTRGRTYTRILSVRARVRFSRRGCLHSRRLDVMLEGGVPAHVVPRMPPVVALRLGGPSLNFGTQVDVGYLERVRSGALVRGADAWIAAGRLGGRPSTALRAGLRTRVRLGKSVHTVSAHDRMQQFTFNAWLPMNLMKRERSRDATHVAAGQSASAIRPALRTGEHSRRT